MLCKVIELIEPDGIKFLTRILSYAQTCEIENAFNIVNQLLQTDGKSINKKKFNPGKFKNVN